ncbi:MAG TPA: hypothetical protein GXX74_08335 [Clostridiales bacterium]|nr:hypothetical protein [Clostridiales bacterium]
MKAKQAILLILSAAIVCAFAGCKNTQGNSSSAVVSSETPSGVLSSEPASSVPGSGGTQSSLISSSPATSVL